MLPDEVRYKNMQEILIGNLTIDQNTIDNNTYTMPGGSVFFMAKTFENLGDSSTIISPYGADFPKKYLPQTLFVPSRPPFEKTLIFRNKYRGGKREQVVENYAQYLSFDWQERLTSVAPDSDIVAVAPILNNIDAGQIKAIKEFFQKSFFVLLPQGFYRQIDALFPLIYLLFEIQTHQLPHLGLIFHPLH